jgi:hypothetical protein
VNGDKLASVDIHMAEATSANLEEFITELAMRRSNMTPAVSDLPVGGSETHDLGNPDLQVQALHDGSVQVHFAHPGIEWMRVTLTQEAAKDFAEKVVAAIRYPDESGSRH